MGAWAGAGFGVCGLVTGLQVGEAFGAMLLHLCPGLNTSIV